MFYERFTGQLPTPVLRSHRQSCAFLCLAFALFVACVSARAQSLERELNAPEKAFVTIRNPFGRVVVTAADEQEKKISIKADSIGASVAESDVRAATSGGIVEIDVQPRNERNRIDLFVRVPARARVKVRTEAGAVDVIGNFAEAEVATNTGTIRSAVPVDAVRYSFAWQASRPRYFSDVELPKEKEKAGGEFTISGKLGDAKAKQDARVELRFSTQRGVVLFNVDPEMVPADLRERPLTKAAQAIVESGDSELIEAIHKVSPRLFAEYTRGLPPHAAAPTLIARRTQADVATPVGGRLMRLNVSVTDRVGRAISDLKAADFTVIENGEARKVESVVPASAPFNLVLLLDVSGSVEERLDFIRKAAQQFLNTASAQDRIAILSFRDDIQLISDFSDDRALLAKRLDQIDAGGATALYDALAYALVHTLRPLRGERTAIVVLSDGDDNKSFVPFPSLLEATRESGALIYPLYVPSELIPEGSASVVGNAATTIDPLRTRYLTVTSRADAEGRKLASVSGGVYYPITRLDELQRAYDDVVAQLRVSYTITYQSSMTDARERRVRVRVDRDGASVRLSPAVNVATN